MNSTSGSIRLHRFKRHFFCFFILGQNACHPTNVTRKRFIHYLPSIFTLLLVLHSEYTLMTKRFKRVEKNHRVFLHSIMLINMMPSLIAAIESFRMPNGTIYLIKTFSAIIKYIEEKTLTKIDWELFHKKICLKHKRVLLCYFVTVFFRLWLRSPLYGRVYELSSAILWFYRIISVLHSVFYIDLLTLLMSSVSLAIRAQAKAIRHRVCSKSLCDVINILNDVKYQHFKLWQCAGMLNKYFGWILVIDFMDSAFSITYDGYSLFFSISVYGKNIFLHLRNYISFVVINDMVCLFFVFCFRVK